jgi:TatD DNase family protein
MDNFQTDKLRDSVLVDSHAHLELDPLYKQAAEVVKRAAAAGVAYIVTVGIDLEDIKRALEIAERFPNVFASVGLHPHNVKDVGKHGLSRVEEAAHHPKVVAYGEIGLDFFRDLSPRDLQISVFSDQLSIAKALGKPVVIHLRDAYTQGLEMLEKAAPFPSGGMIHCFSGDAQDARRALDLGFHISIPGTVTYKKNDALRSVVRELPEDRILLETDCPFLAPAPLRGKDNEPAYIVHTAAKVAEIREVSVDYIAKVTTENAKRIFKIAV